MKNRIHLYVSRKNALTWLMALCMVCSAVARIALSGLKGSGDAHFVWSQIVPANRGGRAVRAHRPPVRGRTVL